MSSRTGHQARRLLLLAVLAASCRARPLPPADSAIRQELLDRVAGDQAIRDTLVEALRAGGQLDTLLIRRMNRQDSANGAWLKSVLTRYAWPGISSVGREASEAAFLIVQHARNDPAWQAAVLPLIEEAYGRGDVEGQDLALLTDEVLGDAGKPQRYGTKADLRDGRLVFRPIEDSAHVDERRARLGMKPLAEYARLMDSIYGPGPRKP